VEGQYYVWLVDNVDIELDDELKVACKRDSKGCICIKTKEKLI
jgi:hypothetical protein